MSETVLLEAFSLTSYNKNSFRRRGVVKANGSQVLNSYTDPILKISFSYCVYV